MGNKIKKLGWIKSPESKVWHFFNLKSSVSLCGKVGVFFGPVKKVLAVRKKDVGRDTYICASCNRLKTKQDAIIREMIKQKKDARKILGVRN